MCQNCFKKRSYFESLDVKFIKVNKKFWKKISPLFSNKIKSKKKRSHLQKILKSFQVIQRSKKHIFLKPLIIQFQHALKSSLSIPVQLVSKNVWKQPVTNSLLNKKKKLLTEIENLDFRKASKENDIPVKILQENSDIYSFVLHLNFNNSLFSNKFPKYLKKSDTTPVFKRDEKFFEN